MLNTVCPASLPGVKKAPFPFGLKLPILPTLGRNGDFAGTSLGSSRDLPDFYFSRLEPEPRGREEVNLILKGFRGTPAWSRRVPCPAKQTRH